MANGVKMATLAAQPFVKEKGAAGLAIFAPMMFWTWENFGRAMSDTSGMFIRPLGSTLLASVCRVNPGNSRPSVPRMMVVAQRHAPAFTNWLQGNRSSSELKNHSSRIVPV